MKHFTLRLLFVLLFVCAQTFADPVARSVKIFLSDSPEGLIGVTEEGGGDNPADNIFHVNLDEVPCPDFKLWLVYDLDGVEDHTAVSRSINDQRSIGGYLVKKRRGWATQREQISARWLRGGDNVIRFSMPEGAVHNYRIRNLRIEMDLQVSSEPISIHLAGLQFNNTSYLKGFLSDGEDPISQLKIADQDVPLWNGEFESMVDLSTSPGLCQIAVEANHHSGAVSCYSLQFSETDQAEHRFERSSYFQKASAFVDGSTRGSVTLESAVLRTDSGALAVATHLSITPLRDVDIVALDAGMVNVTQGHYGFRFLPHGTTFLKESTLTLPFDKHKIPDGYTEKDIKTYYFDERVHHWIAVPTDTILVERALVVSKTMHFTDYINAIIKMPESPEVEAFNSTSMKGIKAANPTAAVNLINPPQANNTGGASLSYTINIPAGRGGMQPQLAISYNSGGGNGWMGLGWNLTIPTVGIDTRWGVPRYDGDLETETYSINGEMLTPVAHRGPLQSRTSEKRFQPRVEGAFNKIIRHGTNPQEYWWEVTDKSGTRYFYGGSPAGFDKTSLLRDDERNDEGNVTQWCLSEVRDLNGNTVKYHYSKVADVGLAGGTVPGHQIYIDKISYTGHAGSEGPYEVRFIRDRELNEASRKDINIAANLGFKQVTADLLRRIEVKFDGKDIRHYELQYREGAFFKTLLQSIKEFDAAGNLFNTHTLEYYDDVKAERGYMPYRAEEVWDTQADDMNGNFLNIEEFNDKASALSGTNTRTGGGGVSATIGPNDWQLYKKSVTAGMNFGFSHSLSEGRLTLIDLNGDGLSDKVMMFTSGTGGLTKTIKYRPQLKGSENEEPTYGPAQTIEGANEFLKETSDSFDIGLEANFGAFIGNTVGLSRSKTSIYFSDVNGDGLPDIVRKGKVHFNRLNEAGHPTFTTSSAGTPNPLASGGAIDPDLVEEDPAEQEQLIDQNPLHDVVRMWRAPYTGMVSVQGSVKLLEDVSLERSEYETADGIKASIQFKGDPVLWQQVIEANDYIRKDFSLENINVQKGDHIYFRLQSRDDGAYDQVLWDPLIAYTDVSLTDKDANGKTPYRFQASEDYVLASIQRVGMPIDGELHIEGLFSKPITSDSVRVEIWRGDSELLFSRHYSWNQPVDEPLDLDVTVHKDDQFRFKVTTSSNIDWTKLAWRPYLYYTASHDPQYPTVIDSNGNPTLAMHPVPEYSLYIDELVKTVVWQVAEDDTVSIEKNIELLPIINSSSLTMTIKRENELLSKQILTVQGTTITKAVGDTVYRALPVSAGDRIFIELHTPDRSLAYSLTKHSVLINFSDGDTLSVKTGLYTAGSEDDRIFGPLYRNWGMFIYNGNRQRADSPLVESELKLTQFGKDDLPDPVHLEDAGTKEDMDAAFDQQKGYRANEENFLLLVASGSQQLWRGADDLTYISTDTVSSSRLGLDQIRSLSARPDMGTGATAIDKITRSRSLSLALGAGFISGSGTEGSSQVITDFMDMNGDRYPDILSQQKIQYTLPAGGLESGARRHGWDFNHVTETLSGGISVSGGFPKSERQPGNSPRNAMFAAIGESASLNAGKLWSQDEAQYSWVDINGDGLPDRVNAETDRVSLNLGYSFADAEPWTAIDVMDGRGESTSGGLGISLFNKSIQAGVGYSRSDNETKKMLADMNGDGLPDRVSIDDGTVSVRLNLGGGFAANTIPWQSISAVNKGATTTMSTNFAFTIAIPVWLVKIAINPKVNVSQSFNRQTTQISDIDGDGYPDYLHSTEDKELKVKRSTIGRTNMLKGVKRPLGASFTLGYHRLGNTYELPHSQWVLDTVMVVDGFANDGVDTLLTTFAYEGGRYDRLERDFYGFDQVISRTHDTGKAGAPVYTTVTQTFSTQDYFQKGLLLSEVMTDASANKFVEKENSYEVRDVSTEIKFPALTATSQKFYEGQSTAGKSTAMSYAYDAIGNVITYQDFGDEGTTDDLKATITYHDLDALYVKGTPQSITVTGSGITYRKRESVIDPNTSDVIQIKQFLSESVLAIYDMEYDLYGNLTQITRPKNSKDQRLSVQYEYDGTVHMYPTKVSNSYGYSSEAQYDLRFGQVLESSDLNGNKIIYELDPLGRVKNITGPYEKEGANKTIEFEYHPEAAVPWALTHHFDPANPKNTMQTAIFVDGLGRVLQTKKDAALYDGEGKPDTELMVVSGRLEFDAFGRTTKAFYPVTEAVGTPGQLNATFDAITPTTTTYDVMNRTLTLKLPDGAETKTEYGFASDRNGVQQFSTKTTDANGKQTEQFTDVRGRVSSVKNYTTEKEIWTSFVYNAINEQMEATDDLGHTTFSAYDNFGRRIERKHPDAGVTTYSYDLAGNLLQLVTANLQQTGGAIQYDYDHERLVGIAYPENPENNVRYTYGEAGASDNRVGRIVLQEDASGAQEFFYGPLGEVVKNIRTIVIPQNDEQTYVTEWQYDTWNRLTAMTYPDGEQVDYTYNVGGLLTAMNGKKKNSTFSYVKQLGYDKFEQRVFLRYGNGTKTTYDYEPDRRRLRGMTAETAARRLFMDNVYTYDKVNNILSLENKAPIPSNNLMGGSSTYAYSYDDLYRLTSARGNYTGANADHNYSLNMSYNPVGGITRKTQNHLSKGQEQKKTTYDMAYVYGSEQPHAPVHIGDNTYTYDANGNQTGWKDDKTAQERKVMWDEENRIRSMVDNGAFYHYAYDASGERVWKGKGTGQSIFVNGELKAGNGSLGNFVVYVNPYLVLKSGSYTKHYYIEGQRIVSKLGGGFENAIPRQAGDGKVNYGDLHRKVFDGIVKNLKFLGADGQILTAGKSGKIPPGQVNGTGNISESFRYFFHPDHLGSTSYVTDATGEVYQHLEYFAFGETFVEEHSNTERTPYLFNGKELDEETGLYYYGARYYDPRTSIFQSVDGFAEKYPGLTPYHYGADNPINYVDINGDSLNVSQLREYNSQANNSLISDFQAKTGLNLNVDKNGDVTYAKQNGKAIISKDENGKNVGSRAARKALMKMIDSDQKISVGGTSGLTRTDMDGADPNLILINPDQMQRQIDNTSKDLNSTTYGYALTFFHEKGHTAYGGAGQDPPFVPGQNAFEQSGRQERLPNLIRRQLGKSQYGQRISYNSYYVTGDKRNYFPWSQKTLSQLKAGKTPTGKYVIQP